MRRATQYFSQNGYTVENVSGTKPYDLRCSKHGKQLHVEVKGTTSGGDEVILTLNEARWAPRGAKRALFVLHSIRLYGRHTSGGQKWIKVPWTIDRRRLKPISYMYSVPR
jgi:hypothetical protein